MNTNEGGTRFAVVFFGIFEMSDVVGGTKYVVEEFAQRTDTLWKAIGRAAVVQAAVESGPRYVLLTTDAPRKGTAGAKALRNVVGPNGPIHAIIELLDEADWQRLREFALGVDTLPDPGH